MKFHERLRSSHLHSLAAIADVSSEDIDSWLRTMDLTAIPDRGADYVVT